MERPGFLYLLLGLAIGSIVTSFLLLRAPEASRNAYEAGLRKNDERAEQMAGGHMGMESMVEALRGKTGDEYDRAFLEMMIIHHDGAVDMARLSLDQAKHEEIKALSRAIIEAQEKEITQMKAWQEAWGYNPQEGTSPELHH